MSRVALEADRPLAPLTTLGLGGAARAFVELAQRAQLEEVLRHAADQGLRVGILGGGSNLVIADQGFDGLVVRVALRGIELDRSQGLLTAQAGETWDDIVELAVRERLAGIECLSGIPGTVGATPIQNVGAYGQEVGDVIDGVEVFDRTRGAVVWLNPEQCAFSYRDSRFKRTPDGFVVLAVRFRLRADGAPTLRYQELARAVQGARPSLREVQQAVRALRSQKGMLIEPGWERSVGSFFMNPIVEASEAERVAQVALEQARVAVSEQMPRYPAEGGKVKLSAAWLVERAGIGKGYRRGAVGVSSRHSLALVHHGGGSTRDLLALADEIQMQVHSVFGVRLAREPVCW